jgi:hypothetical protein
MPEECRLKFEVVRISANTCRVFIFPCYDGDCPKSQKPAILEITNNGDGSLAVIERCKLEFQVARISANTFRVYIYPCRNGDCPNSLKPAILEITTNGNGRLAVTKRQRIRISACPCASKEINRKRFAEALEDILRSLRRLWF